MTSPAHVLIVDDLEVNRDLLARRVQRLGHTIAFAASGREALVRLRATSFDLVLLDITMPDMDGYEALAQIKSDPSLAPIPVVMVTAIDGVDSVVRCLELGAEDYITKPFNPVVLRARIESSLNKKRVADLNARLLQSMSREMAIAQRIQLGFLPDSLPQLPGWPMAATCVPAKQVGGDFFDAWVLDDGLLAFAVADVCDKGVGAALYMALFRSLLRISLQQAPPGQPAAQRLERAVAFTNDYVATVHARDNMFATTFVAIVDPASGRMDYINAGHDAALLLRQGQVQSQSLPPQGLALGMMAGQAHRACCTRISAGDRLLVYSDGLPEALSPQNQDFGEERVREAVAWPADSPQTLLTSIRCALDSHVGDREPHDDVTLLCLFHSVPGRSSVPSNGASRTRWPS
ncbi:MAG: SpoIIE family protein phosphatase [Leptothrix sp. (in: Bacteria)]|jgi:sigma-B regulation protein RsbU (phosphoserine phosphatase)|nr:SpoIIE family protein phosphatase [Leptothrix sp. (in: b-proteobacteria)]HQY07294.1 SpoIIE family protein phosphatase [Burkholderiaceae bacterium]